MMGGPFRSLRLRFAAFRDHDPRLLDLIYVYLAIKLGLVVVALIGGQLLPFNWPIYNANLVLDIQNLPAFFRSFNTWDTQHYVLLAQSGYGVNPMSNAFFPLYPYLIWVFTPLFLNHGLIAAIVIANLFSLLVPVYLYKLGCLFWTREQAFKSGVMLLAFPTAFFLSVAYSEALYLSICLMAFFYLLKREMLKASLFCFLLPLTRAQALLFVAPLAVLFLQAVFSGKESFGRNVARAVSLYLGPAIASLLGLAAYFAFSLWQLGGIFEGLTAQQLYIGGNSLANLLQLQRWFTSNFVDISLTVHGYTDSILNRAAFLVCLPMLIGIYRTQNKALFAYAAVTLVIPALGGNFMSYVRVLLAVFPIFIYLGTGVRRAELLAIPMFALQVLLFLLHTGGYWVG